MKLSNNNKVKLLKDEFAKYSGKGNSIQQEGFEKIGKELDIDIYNDVRIANLKYFLNLIIILLL